MPLVAGPHAGRLHQRPAGRRPAQGLRSREENLPDQPLPLRGHRPSGGGLRPPDAAGLRRPAAAGAAKAGGAGYARPRVLHETRVLSGRPDHVRRGGKIHPAVRRIGRENGCPGAGGEAEGRAGADRRQLPRCGRRRTQDLLAGAAAVPLCHHAHLRGVQRPLHLLRPDGPVALPLL